MRHRFPRLPRILIVDDEAINIQVLERIFESGLRAACDHVGPA